MKVIILGPQGSGKGTQAALIAARFKIPTISPGEIFREETRRGTNLGRRIAKTINAGVMAPDAITNRIVKERLGQPDCRRGAILDGYPRTLFQAKYLQNYWQPDHVLFLNISTKEILHRLRGRLVCVGCPLVFHKIYKPSKLKELCESCGGHLERRADDNPAAIRARLTIYRQETVPVIKFYEKFGLVRKIGGEKNIETVWQEIQKAFKRN